MKPRISVITLGVDALERALAFYRDGLGFGGLLAQPGLYMHQIHLGVGRERRQACSHRGGAQCAGRAIYRHQPACTARARRAGARAVPGRGNQAAHAVAPCQVGRGQGVWQGRGGHDALRGGLWPENFRLSTTDIRMIDPTMDSDHCTGMWNQGMASILPPM